MFIKTKLSSTSTVKGGPDLHMLLDKSRSIGILPIRVWLFVLLSLGAGVATWFLQRTKSAHCVRQGLEMCAGGLLLLGAEPSRHSHFFLEHPVETLVLILTHIIPFVMIPITMYYVGKMGPLIQQNHQSFDPHLMQLGLATICLSVALEYGWHMTKVWYYVNDFHLLNFAFFFLLISSFALWANGFGSIPVMNKIFIFLLILVSAFYPLGAIQAATDGSGLSWFPSNPKVAKIPVYIGLTVTFSSIIHRGWTVFGPRMGLVFFFSVVVNLFFLALLQRVPKDEPNVWNYRYHIAHDILGTEMGVAYFTYLVATYNPPKSANSTRTKED